ncbi:hypothetical protein H4R35_004788 [Dimargaris xerosporica]|nr:hypothetical protein H4R35_004788 [Dimargaris xerosporica]
MVRVLVYCGIDVALNTAVYAWIYGRHPALELVRRTSRQLKIVVWDTGLHWTIAMVRAVDIWLYQTGFPHMLMGLRRMYHNLRFAGLHMVHGLRHSLLWLIDVAIVVHYHVLRPAARAARAMWHRIQRGLASMYRLALIAIHCTVVVGQDLWADVQYLVQGLVQLTQRCHQVLLRPLGLRIVQTLLRAQQMGLEILRITSHWVLWISRTARVGFQLASHGLASCRQLTQRCAVAFVRLWATTLLPLLVSSAQCTQMVFHLSRRYAMLGLNGAWQWVLVPFIRAVQPWVVLIGAQMSRALQLSYTWITALSAWLQEGLYWGWAHLSQGAMCVALWTHTGLLYVWSVLEHSAYPLGCHIMRVVGAWLSVAWSVWVQYGWPWVILFGRWAEYRSSQLQQWVVRQGPLWWQAIEPHGQRLQQQVLVFADQLVQTVGNGMMEWTKDWHQGYASTSR